jgi:hypothetical protein
MSFFTFIKISSVVKPSSIKTEINKIQWFIRQTISWTVNITLQHSDLFRQSVEQWISLYNTMIYQTDSQLNREYHFTTQWFIRQTVSWTVNITLQHNDLSDRQSVEQWISLYNTVIYQTDSQLNSEYHFTTQWFI